MLTDSVGAFNVFFYLRSGEFNRSQYFMRDMTQLISHRNFNPKLPSVLYISGWMQSPDAETTELIINGYLKRRDHNLLILDWSDYSVGLYTSVMLRISKISRIFGRTMLKLFDKGLNIKTFHCLGHSFGAHSCGIIGRELIQVSNRKYKLGRFVLCLHLNSFADRRSSHKQNNRSWCSRSRILSCFLRTAFKSWWCCIRWFHSQRCLFRRSKASCRSCRLLSQL